MQISDLKLIFTTSHNMLLYKVLFLTHLSLSERCPKVIILIHFCFLLYINGKNNSNIFHFADDIIALCVWLWFHFLTYLGSMAKEFWFFLWLLLRTWQLVINFNDKLNTHSDIAKANSLILSKTSISSSWDDCPWNTIGKPLDPSQISTKIQ